jgi:hypothetical protein
MSDTNLQRQKDDEAFMRAWTIPEEDRPKYTTQAWSGEYRWFRSANMIPIEQAKAKRERERK